MQDIRISNGYIQLWATHLRSLNIEPLQADFLQDLHTPLSHLIDQPFDTEVPLELLNLVIERTQAHLHCPQLIFEIVQSIRPEHFGVLGYMASKSSSISEMIGYIMRFQRLVVDGSEFVPLQIKQHEYSIELYWDFIHEKYQLLNELTIAAMVQLGRYILQDHPLVLRCVRFAHAPLMTQRHYQKFFGLDVHFSQAYYGFELDLHDLKLKSEQADPMLLQLLIRQAEEAIAAKSSNESTLQQARKIIADHLRTEQQAIKIEQLAQQLWMSSRSLQRYLSEQGSSFKKLLEQERMKRCEMLLQQGISLTEIAQQLDYSDQSALARAYKAATGQTLLQARKQLKIEEEKK
ncbi:AraC family transcriptional regulator [Acinetobacter sp. LoGeW2-3]|uniref:helix-turn-helix domain-containing protein n=1 Tax=Acinetobacter sp. LoGeW2-3 TaxID=1808001 RepID=UPI000C05971C|nr:AraC family transcriptional regulator [Acinetobacter sp. LoGeW2-3]ATO18584.1 AraC family transcriptional regulator [Acinetobacter sp. LoGeW2-3]